jgi:hypothetical protein
MPYIFLYEMGMHILIKAKHVTFLNFIVYHDTIISAHNDLCGLQTFFSIHIVS